MPILTAILPAVIALALLVCHAARIHGWRWALEFFGLAFLYFVVKENLSVAGYFHVYLYTRPPPLRIWDAPLGVVVGWLFTSYVSWTLATRILDRFPACRGSLAPTVFVAMIVTATISYPMEALGTSMGWWHWTVDGKPWTIPTPGDGSNAWVVIPPVPLVGWAFFVAGFLSWLGIARTVGVRHSSLRYLCFAAGSALHFVAIHGIGSEMPELLLVLGASSLVALAWAGPARAVVPAPRSLAGSPWAIRHAVEISLGLMMVVVCAFEVVAIHRAELWLTVLPIALFGLASQHRAPTWTLAVGWLAAWVFGVVTASPKVFSLGFFPMLFHGVLGLRAAGLRFGFGRPSTPESSPTAPEIAE